MVPLQVTIFCQEIKLGNHDRFLACGGNSHTQSRRSRDFGALGPCDLDMHLILQLTCRVSRGISKKGREEPNGTEWIRNLRDLDAKLATAQPQRSQIAIESSDLKAQSDPQNRSRSASKSAETSVDIATEIAAISDRCDFKIAGRLDLKSLAIWASKLQEIHVFPCWLSGNARET